MVRTEAIIGINDVEKSSEWYQKLLSCKSAHGGPIFEMLQNDGGETVLLLHKWEAHGHPTLSDSSIPVGNGLILYFRVGDLQAVWGNAQALAAKVEEAPNTNTNSGQEEFALRDPNGYYLLIST